MLIKGRPLKKIQDEILPSDEIEALFFDEAFFRRESTVTRGWYPKGQKSTVSCPVTFEKVGVCGAVNPRDGRLFSLIFDRFDSDVFIYYLQWLITEYKTNKKIVLILDNASPHKSLKVREFVKSHDNRLELLFLPPYSPDLNPIERVWKDLRYQVTHNVYFPNRDIQENAIINYLNYHFLPNKHLKSLCCNK